MPRKWIFVIVLALGTSWLPAEDVGAIPRAVPPLYALKGATVVVGNGQVLSNATVVIRDGLIDSVGPGVAIPPGAWEIEAAGLYVYPGLIDALTSNGLKKKPRAAERGGGGPGRPSGSQEENEEGPGNYAHRAASDELDADDKKLESWRNAGVSTLHVAHADGIFRGSTVVVNLNGQTADQMIVHDRAAMSVAFETQGFRTYPGSLMGVIAHLRQTLHDARHYRLAWTEYEREKRGMKRPQTDRILESLQPVVEGELPLLVPAQREREIGRSLRLCAEVGVGCIVAGGFEAAGVADELRESGVPVLVSLNYPKKPRDPHPEDKEAVSELRYRVDAPAAAGKLAQAGVRFAFFSDGASATDFVPNLRKAVERGLSREDAIRAASLSAAEILGVQQQLGSIETGKIANLIVADGDLFEEDTQIQKVFVDGTPFEVPSKPKTAGGEQGKPGASLAGRWQLTVEAPGQSYEMSLDLTQDEGILQGQVVTDQGSLEIYDGTASGDTFSLKFQVDFGAGPQEVTLSGTISGDSLSGSATVANLGSAPMQGRRVP